MEIKTTKQIQYEKPNNNWNIKWVKVDDVINLLPTYMKLYPENKELIDVCFSIKKELTGGY